MKILKTTVSMRARDGVRLDADLYRPDVEGPFPVLLMRQPYGRAIASTVVYAHPQWYAERGYIVVIQDVRGRGTSEGEFDPFAREIEDGCDAVNWAARLPGSTGEVGMYGFSYQGMTQLYAAIAQPPALKVLCPAMVGYNLYSDWAYENGAFCLQANLGWAVQLAAETARIKGDRAAFDLLYAASRNLPFDNPSQDFTAVFEKYTPGNFYNEWLNHPEFDRYWQQLSPNLEGVDLPMLHVGGWFDPYLRGTLNLYREMRDRDSLQHLLIGPWGHLPWGRKLGEVDYGPTASSPVDELQIRWFDYFLKGIDTGITEELPARLFEMGSNQWHFFKNFSDPNRKNYVLSSNGLASLRENGGKLSLNSTQNWPEQSDILVRDPWRPVPASGGHAASPAGSFDRSHLDCRSDILTYMSEPLAEDLRAIGEAVVEVYCTTDAPSFDLCATLSEVRPDGRAYNFTQGYLRVKENCTPLKIPLQATCIRLARGNCLRLSLSADCFPAYPVNPGTGRLPTKVSSIEAQIITLAICSGGDRPSKISLAIAP